MPSPKKPNRKQGLKDLKGKKLTPAESKAIRGGKGSLTDITITKSTNKGSP